jgi:hypothetical protein
VRRREASRPGHPSLLSSISTRYERSSRESVSAPPDNHAATDDTTRVGFRAPLQVIESRE